MGLLGNVISVANENPSGGAYRFGHQIKSNAETISKPYNCTFTNSFSNNYDFGSIVWAMGSGTLSGGYEGNMISTENANGVGGIYSYNGDASFTYRDIFTDPADLIQLMYGNSSAPDVPPGLITATNLGGTPFVITGNWTQSFSGGGNYE